MTDVLATYREASPGLKRVMSLFPDKLTLVGSVTGGQDFETHISLKELEPDFGFVRFRSRRCAFGITLFTGLSVLLWLFIGPFELPVTSTRVIMTAVSAAASLAFALAYVPKYTCYRFLNSSGIIVIDIIEAGPDNENCRAFVEQVAQAIRDASS